MPERNERDGYKNMANIYGYIRVSSRDLNEDRQTMAFQELSIPDKNIFIDKQSGSTRQKGLQQQKPEGYVLADLHVRCQKASMKPISSGNRGNLREQQRQRPVECHYQRSVTGQRFTKKPSYCKQIFLQKCVLFCHLKNA